MRDNKTEMKKINGDDFAAEQGYANLQEMREALKKMSRMEFEEIIPETLTELTDIEIDDSLPVEERVLSLLRQTKNPYFYRYNGAVVKLSFAGRQTLEECIAKVYHYYHCSSSSKGEGCSSHLINEKVLSDTVLEMVRLQARMLIDAERAGEIAEETQQERPGVKATDMQIQSLREEVERYQNLCLKLYQDKCDDIITKEEYQNMNARFRDKIKSAKEAIKQLEKKRKIYMSTKFTDRPWMQMFQKYKDVDKVERQMVVSLIEGIFVYDKKHIEIRFRYSNEINDFLSAFQQDREVDV